MAKIVLVAFDMDGVLIDSMPMWRQAVKATAVEDGSGFDAGLWRRARGRRLDELVEYWCQEKKLQHFSQEEFHDQVLERAIALIEARGEMLPGVEKILKWIKRKGVPTAVASSSYKRVMEVVIERLGLEGEFNEVHSAEHEEYGKPHPDVYLTVAKKLKVSPLNTLVIEDSLQGLIAARAAQMSCLMVPDKKLRDDPRMSLASKVLDSLEKFDEAVWKELEQGEDGV